METKHQIYSQEQPIIAVRTEKLTSEDESNELLGDIKFAVWYIRLRDKSQTRTAFDGILKIENLPYLSRDFSISIWFKEEVRNIWTSLFYADYSNSFISVMPTAWNNQTVYRIKEKNINVCLIERKYLILCPDYSATGKLSVL